MEIEFEHAGTTVNIKLNGMLDTPTSQKIEPTVNEILSLNPVNINVDCSNLDYIASWGLRLLIAMRKTTSAQGGQTTLKGVNPSVMTVLRITNFCKIFNIED